MAEIISKSSPIIRFEKQELILQRQALGKIVEFADKYYEFKDAIKDMAEEAGRDGTWLWNWCLNILDKDSETNEEESDED